MRIMDYGRYVGANLDNFYRDSYNARYENAVRGRRPNQLRRDHPMRKRKTRIVRLGLVGAPAVTLPVVWAGQAFADYAPQPNDIVGVGGDTPQFAVDFTLNGDTSGDLGLDSTATVNRVVDFDATADGNARSSYTDSVTTGAASVALN